MGRIPKDTIINTVNGSRMMINACTDHIRGDLNPNYELFREIRNYSRNVKKIDSVYITIHNRSETESPQINYVSHEINYRSRSWIFSASHKSGLERTEKPVFINV